MGLKTINEQLERIRSIVENWDYAQEVSSIERELVLDKLKSIYEHVMFYEREGAMADGDAQCNVAGEGECDVFTPVPEPVSEPESISSAEQVSASEPSFVSELAPEPSRESSWSDSTSPSVADASLFDMSEMPQSSRSHLDRRRVLSLYGEPDEAIGVGTQPEPEEEVEEIVVEQIIQVVEREPESDDQSEPNGPSYFDAPSESNGLSESDDQSEPNGSSDFDAPSESDGLSNSDAPSESDGLSNFDALSESYDQSRPGTQPESHIESRPTQDRPRILGEVINAGEERLGDTFSRTNLQGADIASRVASSRTLSLRHSIGINDKFLIIAEIFGGDSPAYEEAIDKLDSFTDLDDAMIHIHENYSWNPDNAGVRLLVEMLSRKLS